MRCDVVFALADEALPDPGTKIVTTAAPVIVIAPGLVRRSSMVPLFTPC